MKRALELIAFLLFLTSPALAAPSNGQKGGAPDEVCTPKVETFHLLPEPQKKEETAAADVAPIPHPTGRGSHRVRLEANDDLASLTFPAGAISPYVGASIDLLPLPNSDPETATAQVLAYGLGAGFGCDLGASTRLSLRYQIRFFSEDDPVLADDEDSDEIHRISLGLQKSF